MKDKITIFGAGAIGRGLVADITAAKNWKVTFVEANEQLVNKLRDKGKYSVYLYGKHDEIHEISDFQVLCLKEKEIIFREISESYFIATAAGVNNLEAIAEYIAGGLEERKEHLNILMCENMLHAADILSDYLKDKGGKQKDFTCIPCSVERMARCAGDNLDIQVEYGQTLYIDETGWLGRKPDLDEFLFCDNIEAYYKRKLFTNNAGHALLAYLGYLQEYDYIHQALENNQIRKCLDELLAAASTLMQECYGFSRSEIEEHVNELVKWRFSNYKLADTVKRVARDPLRKLGPEERLIGLAKMLEKYNIPTAPVCRVVAAALNYRDADDESSKKLAQISAESGVESVLVSICELEKGSRIYNECLCFFEEQRKRG